MEPTRYVGRFAPSPTGPLHFGSLLAAMASYADAKSNNGLWRLRIDDIDPPRAQKGAVDQIPKTLQQFGFRWDGNIIHQSTRTASYQQALSELNRLKRLYACGCSRRDLSAHAFYPGTCRPSTASQSLDLARQQVQQKLTLSDKKVAIRVIMDNAIAFDDQIQGAQRFDVDKHFADAVLLRRDDLFSYALCCAVDDADEITHIVRGSDLLPTTATQISIIRLLEKQEPRYAHIPVVTNKEAQKLSKQTRADAIDGMPVLPTLLKAWRCLGQDKLQVSSESAFWEAAFKAWNLHKVPSVNAIEEHA